MRKKRKQLFFFLLLLMMLFFLAFRRKIGGSLNEIVTSIVCDEKRGRKELNDVCMLYKHGKVAGNLCEHICSTGDLVIEQCFSHKNDNVIFSADWKERKVILKTKKISGHGKWEDTFPESLNNLTELRQLFLTVVHDSIISQLVNFKIGENHPLNTLSPEELLSQLYFNASVADLERSDMKSLWSLLQQDEYFVLQLLQSSRHIPHVYGTCGRFYVMEKVQTLDSYIGLSILSEPLTWKTCLEMAVEIMHLVQELRSGTMYGSWEHCDIQPSNFGVDNNGVVKTIDVDFLLTSEKTSEIISQSEENCSANADCEFFDCTSLCSMQTKKCSQTRLSNNLQVICRDLFISKWMESGLLSSKIRPKLTGILRECSATPKIPWTASKYNRIFNTLNVYLKDELKGFS